MPGTVLDARGQHNDSSLMELISNEGEKQLHTYIINYNVSYEGNKVCAKKQQGCADTVVIKPPLKR